MQRRRDPKILIHTGRLDKGLYLRYLAVLYLSGKAPRAPVAFPLRIPFPCNRRNAFPTINKTSLLNPHLKTERSLVQYRFLIKQLRSYRP